MTEQAIVEYVTNCAWQIPLLAAGAWVVVKLVRPALRTEYWLWVAVLAMAVVLPLRGVEGSRARHGRGTLVDVRPVEERVPTVTGAEERFVSRSGDAAEVRGQVKAMSYALAAGLRDFRLQMSVRATHWFVGLYVAAMLFAVLRLMGAWRRSRTLVREGLAISPEAEAARILRDVAERMGIEVPEMRESDGIAGPMVVGALRPVLLLPEGAQEYEKGELRAALCHELAHVRRKDYLVNLMCEAAMLPVSWHPIANAVERRIQQTREMVCDEMAAGEMESGEGYARCLVSVTRRIMERPIVYERTQAVSFFDRNTLEERVMRLTDEGATMTAGIRAMRILCGGLAMAAVVGVAATCHVRPAFGAEVAGQSAVAGSAPAAAVEPKPSAQEVQDESMEVQAQPEVKEHKAAVAIARGKHATVTAEPGEYVHRWKSEEGEDFAMVNHDAAEPSEDEQRAVEEKLSNARIEDDLAKIRIDVPEIRLNMKQLELNKVEIDKAQRLMNDSAMRKQIEDAQRQIAELRINPPQIDLRGMKLQLDMADDARAKVLLDSKINLALANEGQFNEKITKAMQGSEEAMAKAQKELESGELKARLDAAQQTLNDVRRRLDELQKEKK